MKDKDATSRMFEDVENSAAAAQEKNSKLQRVATLCIGWNANESHGDGQGRGWDRF